MRNAGRLKLGYYPLPQEEGVRLRKLLQFIEPASVLDPCAGTGAALLQITSAAQCDRYAVELDAERALACATADVATIQGKCVRHPRPCRELFSSLSKSALRL